MRNKRVKLKTNHNNFFPKNRRGLSPVIATVLLISMVVIIGMIVFLWFRGMIGESVIKFGKNIELSCDDVVFDASYADGTLYISNDGNVPIYDIQIQFFSGGSHATREVSSFGDWGSLGNYGLRQGKSFLGGISSPITSPDKLILNPILLGSTDDGEESFVCDGKQYETEIIL